MLQAPKKSKEMQLIMPDFDARSAFRNPVKKGKKIFEICW